MFVVGAQGLPRAALFTPAVGHSLRFDTRVARSQRLIVEPWGRVLALSATIQNKKTALRFMFVVGAQGLEPWTH